MWLWISNLAVLFGQELNAELERGRELDRRRCRAERDLQLEPRDAPKDLEAKGVEASRDGPLPPRGRGRARAGSAPRRARADLPRAAAP